MSLQSTTLLVLAAALLSSQSLVAGQSFPFNFNQVLIWPLPKNMSGLQVLSRRRTVVLDPNTQEFAFIVDSSADYSLIHSGVARYQQIIFGNHGSKDTSGDDDNVLKSVTIKLTSARAAKANPPLDFGVDESYQLTLPSSATANAASIQANTVWGALRALETFSQCLHFNATRDSFVQLYSGVIEDEPRFAHRALMVDTANHFLPIVELRRMIDAMEFNKFNVLHWHIVDAGSFALQVKKYPELTKQAYTLYERYTQRDIEHLVQTYARERGVRVVVEIDTPGHIYVWCVAYPFLCAYNQTCVEDVIHEESEAHIPLDPTVNVTYTTVQGVWSEVLDLFSDTMVHSGGDEVDTTCWSQTPSVVERQKQMGLNDLQTENYYNLQVHQILAELGAQKGKQRLVVQWQEAYVNSVGTSQELPKNTTVIEVWRDFDTLAEVVANGYQSIFTHWLAWV